MRRRRRGSVSADDDDEERQIARNLWRHMRLLPPTGVWRKRWNKWLLLLVLWNIIFLPLNLCFVRGPDPLSRAMLVRERARPATPLSAPATRKNYKTSELATAYVTATCAGLFE